MKLIVAVDACWAIGKDGDQLCYIPPDLKRFQRLTTGHPVILGRKTLATFPRRCPGGRGGLCHLEGRPGRRAGGYLCHWRSLRIPAGPGLL